MPRALRLLPLSVLVISLSACNDSSSSSSDPTKVTTSEGTVTGQLVSDNNGGEIKQWLGIPFAQSTAGANRFREPQNLEPRTTVLQATEFGDACPQTPAQSPFAIQSSNPGSTTSEDCLNLNIYAPSEGDNYPVVVWIHGGSLETGAGFQSSGMPDRLVREGVIVVALNYRLGLLGYLAHPALTATSQTADKGSGNYGLMDQIKALEWLQANVEEFGGNPNNITLVGESAGGFSIKGLMAAHDRTDGLFQRVIVQSGPSFIQETPTVAEQRGASFMAGVCAEDSSSEAAECLRNLTLEQILSLQAGDPEFSTAIVQRSGILEQNVAAALASGQFTADQVLEGSNRDEWRLFVAAEQLVSGRAPLEQLLAGSSSAYRQELIRRYGSVTEANADAVVDLYPLSEYENADAAVSAVGTDAIFACPGFGNIASAAQHVPVYAYEFTDRNAPLPSPLFATAQPELGAAHATEIPYVFASYAALDNEFSEDSATLADTMVRYWASFARTGDPTPSDGTLPAWLTFVNQGYQSLQAPAENTGPFTEKTDGQTFSQARNCNLWLGG
ncbi:carboxylesterase family protein [Marinobacter sp. S6332]|nr:carboxylesterase family protein [Marinobacter sp. S6332]MCK0163952.1 carboxylesterase family protein [Marinobacter sp. S6332]